MSRPCLSLTKPIAVMGVFTSRASTQNQIVAAAKRTRQGILGTRGHFLSTARTIHQQTQLHEARSCLRALQDMRSYMQTKDSRPNVRLTAVSAVAHACTFNSHSRWHCYRSLITPTVSLICYCCVNFQFFLRDSWCVGGMRLFVFIARLSPLFGWKMGAMGPRMLV
jgi:hypothetical protein